MTIFESYKIVTSGPSTSGDEFEYVLEAKRMQSRKVEHCGRISGWFRIIFKMLSDRMYLHGQLLHPCLSTENLNVKMTNHKRIDDDTILFCFFQTFKVKKQRCYFCFAIFESQKIRIFCFANFES